MTPEDQEYIDKVRLPGADKSKDEELLAALRSNFPMTAFCPEEMEALAKQWETEKRLLAEVKAGMDICPLPRTPTKIAELLHPYVVEVGDELRINAPGGEATILQAIRRLADTLEQHP